MADSRNQDRFRPVRIFSVFGVHRSFRNHADGNDAQLRSGTWSTCHYRDRSTCSRRCRAVLQPRGQCPYEAGRWPFRHMDCMQRIVCTLSDRSSRQFRPGGCIPRGTPRKISLRYSRTTTVVPLTTGSVGRWFSPGAPVPGPSLGRTGIVRDDGRTGTQ